MLQDDIAVRTEEMHQREKLETISECQLLERENDHRLLLI